ncbi:SDR family NAD(P)-dependent oxidoreductase [Streptomyces sp. OE57]|uniref:SDR family NAD(P)-dependent oxidoreductase n=1 Tax=Streptomyces lacaronensis TaxID=3379885 RepID=UPI0039B78739
MTPTSLRVVVITGGTRGIGHEVADRFAERGDTVVFNYAGNKRAAADTVAALRASGGPAVSVQGDVADARSGRGCPTRAGRRPPLPDCRGPGSHRTRTPAWYTDSTRCRSRMSRAGSPVTASRSAPAPGATRPFLVRRRGPRPPAGSPTSAPPSAEGRAGPSSAPGRAGARHAV